MDFASFLALATAMAILSMIPGPGVFATVGTALASGMRPALGVIFGLSTADIIFLLFAIFGLSMVAEALGDLFYLIRMAGGAYLIWFGIKLIRSGPAQMEAAAKTPSGKKSYFTGLFITFGNPKVILFYCGFLPTFMNLKTLTPTGIALACLTVSVVHFMVLGTYALLASKARVILTEKNGLGFIQKTAGGLMMATGLKLATET
ncbi:MAG: LysE family translocator [Desulfobacterales bacterium]|nr:LysE family translocator [Desulfobacterales bacterium]